jgi:solute:Na+ symporter, SSS family
MLIFFFVMGVYFILMTWIGYRAGRNVNTMEDYVIAGRRLPFWIAVPTIVATWFGAGSSMGVSGTVYSQGFYGVLADPFGCSLALLITGLFFAVPFRRLRLLTLSDLLSKYYGPTFERVSTFLMVPFYIGTLASQMLAMGYVFHIVGGISPQLGTLIGSLIVVIYTVAGGMWAVSLTDCIQFILMITGLVVLLPVCFENLQDNQATVFNVIGQEFKTLVPFQQENVDWLAYSGRLLMTGLGAIMGQDLLQRSFASKSESVARWSAISGSVIYFVLGLIPLFIGIAGRYIMPGLEQPEQLIPLMAKKFLNPLTFALFACGLLSAIMSTADSYLLAGTSLLTNNILLKIWPVKQESRKIRLLRIVNILLALFSLGLAFSGYTIFDMMVHSGAMLFVAIFVPVSAALFWDRANVPAAWSGLFSGIVAWAGFLIWNRAGLSVNAEDVLFSAAAFGGGISLLGYVIATAIVELRSRKFVLANTSS